MKIAYIAHPIGGDVENNLAKIRAIVREINLTEPDVVPFAPYYADCVSLNDSNPSERTRGIRNDLEIFKRGVIDELRLYGDRISAGMWEEVKLAESLRIPIVANTAGTYGAFARYVFERADQSIANAKNYLRDSGQ